MHTLTSRERVRFALNHKEANRVPVDVGGSRVTGMAAIAYKNVLAHLDWREDIHVYDLKQQLVEPSLAMINRLGGAAVQIHRLTGGISVFQSRELRSREQVFAYGCGLLKRLRRFAHRLALAASCNTAFDTSRETLKHFRVHGGNLAVDPYTEMSLTGIPPFKAMQKTLKIMFLAAILIFRGVPGRAADAVDNASGTAGWLFQRLLRQEYS